jgi:hypothetical protein
MLAFVDERDPNYNPNDSAMARISLSRVTPARMRATAVHRCARFEPSAADGRRSPVEQSS